MPRSPVVKKTLTEDIPNVLDYLEPQLPAERFIFGTLTIADIAIACFFRNASFARFAVDATRWPLTAGFVERVLETEAFRQLKPFEDRSIRTPVGEVRAALASMGAPLTSETYGATSPRRGMMQI